jgi:hypothetical protein
MRCPAQTDQYRIIFGKGARVNSFCTGCVAITVDK